MSGAPPDHGVVRLSDVTEGSTVNSHRCGPSRQRRGDNPAGELARLVEYDTNLDVGYVVPVQQDVAAAAVDAAGVEAVPHLAEQLSPQRRELLPRTRRGDNGGRTSDNIGDRHLVVHASMLLGA